MKLVVTVMATVLWMTLVHAVDDDNSTEKCVHDKAKTACEICREDAQAKSKSEMGTCKEDTQVKSKSEMGTSKEDTDAQVQSKSDMGTCKEDAQVKSKSDMGTCKEDADAQVKSKSDMGTCKEDTDAQVKSKSEKGTCKEDADAQVKLKSELGSPERPQVRPKSKDSPILRSHLEASPLKSPIDLEASTSGVVRKLDMPSKESGNPSESCSAGDSKTKTAESGEDVPMSDHDGSTSQRSGKKRTSGSQLRSSPRLKKDAQVKSKSEMGTSKEDADAQVQSKSDMGTCKEDAQVKIKSELGSPERPQVRPKSKDSPILRARLDASPMSAIELEASTSGVIRKLDMPSKGSGDPSESCSAGDSKTKAAETGEDVPMSDHDESTSQRSGKKRTSGSQLRSSPRHKKRHKKDAQVESKSDMGTSKEDADAQVMSKSEMETSKKDAQVKLKSELGSPERPQVRPKSKDSPILRSHLDSPLKSAIELEAVKFANSGLTEASTSGVVRKLDLPSKESGDPSESGSAGDSKIKAAESGEDVSMPDHDESTSQRSGKKRTSGTQLRSSPRHKKRAKDSKE